MRISFLYGFNSYRIIFLKVSESLVSDIEDLLLSLEATVCAYKRWLVEWLRLVEVISVWSSDLISVKILFSLPSCTVPALTITLVTTMKTVRSLVYFELLSVLKDSRIVTSSKIRLVMCLWMEEAGSHSCGGVVFRLEICSCVEHSASSITTTSHFNRFIVSWDQFRIESDLRNSKRSEFNVKSDE